ncbi:MAG TPA: hypothetical protein VN026_08430 [Bacteroidia bacterium]|jgi:hypothetical protein|nr:hypothetical protein [Bacteroidia bacterium]
MRNELKKIQGKRGKFYGVFERYGTKTNWKGYPEDTVLLKDIKDLTGKIVADHLWFNLTKGFEKIGQMIEGDIIQFEARAKPYTKGYVNYREGIDDRRTDYRLSHPTKFYIISKINNSTEL